MFAHSTYYESTLGWLCISGNGGSIGGVVFQDSVPVKLFSQIPDYLNFAAEQLEEYFLKGREQFDLKLDIRGTDFQK